MSLLDVRSQQEAGRVTQCSGFTRRDLARHFAEREYRCGAEIGVRQAAFSLALCQAITDLELLCVDPWLEYPCNPKMFTQAKQDANRDRLARKDARAAKAGASSGHEGA